MAEQPSPLALVVDDQPDILEIIGLTLKYHDWRVATARNGREALEAIRRETPQLILADLMMPEMNGIELCRRLLSEFKLNDVPVLLISGVNESAKILNDFWELPLRNHNFLHKPFDTDDLIEAVRSVLPRPLAQRLPAPKARPAAPASAPAAAPPAKPAAPAAPPKAAFFTPEAGRDFRILVVDDEMDIRLVLKTALGMFHTVEEAANGKEGVEAVERFGPDFIIADINMPQMNGMQMAQAIRRHPVFSEVPIFFLTAESDSALPRKAFEIGANLFLRKPLDPIQLLKILDRFIKETGIQPGAVRARAERHAREAEARAKAQAAAPPAPPAGVRVLVIDLDQTSHGLVRSLVAPPAKIAGGPFELVCFDDLNEAMGNMARMEPDVIIYNPRSMAMDGVAFGQSLLLRKLGYRPEVMFIGDHFFDSEIDYTKSHYKRGVVDMRKGELGLKLAEAVAAARKNIKPKSVPFGQIGREEAERQRQREEDQARQSRQQEVLRKRYASIQDFIDTQLD